MFDSIPDEMKQYKSWICWRYENNGESKPTKIPYCAHTELKASVSDPSTWTTFEEACKAAPAYAGIGFVLSESDPFSCIDLDDPAGDVDACEQQKRICEAFNSYTEISPSGVGAHIWLKGKIPSGRRRGKVEVYSSGRYMTLTGNVHLNVPIQERQELLDQLWTQMGKEAQTIPIYKGDEPERENDEEIITKAGEARNGELFKKLYVGQWRGRYRSQSEADYALIDILSFYSNNNAQITRLFRSSQLGKRNKAHRNDYVGNMIAKSRDNRPPPIDMDGLNNQMNEVLARRMQNIPIEATCLTPATSEVDPYSLPPGLLGELARFIYEAAPRPVREIALTGAIGFMSGICGRAYNVSGTGLNQYVLLLAKTGVGKEAMASGISKITNAMEHISPTLKEYVGASQLNSAQAVLRNMSDSLSKSYVSILGEFGLLLQQSQGRNIDANALGLRRCLLDLYNKSGKTDVVQPTIYSDKTKNILVIPHPAQSLLCESTPSEFYKALDDRMINQGLIPRFTIIEYKGDRPDRNDNHINIIPSPLFIQDFATLIARVSMLNSQNNIVDIQYSPDAKKLCDDFDKFCDSEIRKSEGPPREIWSRAHVKALKLASLIAVGVECINPIMRVEHIQWAMNLICSDAHNMIARFEDGSMDQIDEPMSKMLRRIRKMVRKFVYCDNATIKDKRIKIFHSERIVPYTYLLRQLSGNVKGPELQSGLKALVASGELIEADLNIRKKLNNTYGFECFKAELYCVDPSMLDSDL